MTVKEKLSQEIAEIRKRLNTLEVRLTLAQAWVSFQNYAYDSLLYHGVNYRDLKEYKDSTELDDAQKLTVTAGRDKIVQWLGRVKSGIRAAVRRKGFTVHDNPPQ